MELISLGKYRIADIRTIKNATARNANAELTSSLKLILSDAVFLWK